MGWVMTPCALDSLRSPPPASRSFLCPTTTPRAPLPAYTALGAEPTATHPHSDHRDRAAQASGSMPPRVLHFPIARWTPGSPRPCLASLGPGRAELPPRAGTQGLRSSLLPRPLAKAAETVEGTTAAAIPPVTPLWRGDTFLQFWEDGKKGPGVCHIFSPVPFSLKPTQEHPSLPPTVCSLPGNLPQRQRSGGRTIEAGGEVALRWGRDGRRPTSGLSSYGKGVGDCPSTSGSSPGPQRPTPPLLPGRQEGRQPVREWGRSPREELSPEKTKPEPSNNNPLSAVLPLRYTTSQLGINTPRCAPRALPAPAKAQSPSLPEKPEPRQGTASRGGARTPGFSWAALVGTAQRLPPSPGENRETKGHAGLGGDTFLASRGAPDPQKIKLSLQRTNRFRITGRGYPSHQINFPSPFLVQPSIQDQGNPQMDRWPAPRCKGRVGWPTGI